MRMKTELLEAIDQKCSENEEFNRTKFIEVACDRALKIENEKLNSSNII